MPSDRRALAAWVVIALGLVARAGAADVVVVVAPQNPLAALSRNDLEGIYLGRTDHFPDGSPAVPIDQPDGAGDRAAFYAGVIGRSAAQVKAHWAKLIFTGRGQPPRQAADGAAVRALVANSPAAIGYLDSNLIDDSVKPLRVD